MNIGSQPDISINKALLDANKTQQTDDKEQVIKANLPSVQSTDEGFNACITTMGSSLKSLDEMSISIPTDENVMTTPDIEAGSVQEPNTPQGGANSIVSEISPSTIQEPKASEDDTAALSLSRHTSQGSLPTEGNNTLKAPVTHNIDRAPERLADTRTRRPSEEKIPGSSDNYAEAKPMGSNVNSETTVVTTANSSEVKLEESPDTNDTSADPTSNDNLQPGQTPVIKANEEKVPSRSEAAAHEEKPKKGCFTSLLCSIGSRKAEKVEQETRTDL
ncbi:hypothetical protein [uncultured Endozoicomonas sp.]|uniref:hypothetical protein n=1 Tax=uncultured Endozoicomonas sp. TaxID=432652 RepID=UPI002628B7A9|nr:hypothetical protein [uncultured Endozoicomonas sp.]